MSPISSYLFEFLVTPAGTTTLEVAGWIAFLTLLIYGDRRRIRNSAEKPKGPEERTAYVTPSLAHPQLRRRPIAHVDGTVDGTISFDVNATDALRRIPAAPASSLPFSSKLKYYATLTIIAYILDAALFLMISIAMHKSILFIPTPCSNATTVNDACDYSFGFDREFYLVNPSTNDTIHLVYIKGKGKTEVIRDFFPAILRLVLLLRPWRVNNKAENSLRKPTVERHRLPIYSRI